MNSNAFINNSNNVFKLLSLLIVFFAISCYTKEIKKIRIIGNDIQPPANLEFSMQYISIQNDILSLLSKSRENKYIINSELSAVRKYLRNFYKINYYSLPIIINENGIILIHKNKNFEYTNINNYIDYANGLDSIFKNDFIIFHYSITINHSIKKKYHVSSYNIKEINIRIIIITPLLIP